MNDREKEERKFIVSKKQTGKTIQSVKEILEMDSHFLLVLGSNNKDKRVRGTTRVIGGGRRVISMLAQHIDDHDDEGLFIRAVRLAEQECKNPDCPVHGKKNKLHEGKVHAG